MRAKLLTVIALLLSGCFGSEAKNEYFYKLDAPLRAIEPAKGPRLVVTSFSAAAGYDTTRLAFRDTGHELQYYAYRQWAAEPARMLAESTIRYLRASQRFSEVASADKLRDPDAVLEGSLDAIEEIDHARTWDAHLAMTFALRKGDSDRVLMRYAFDEKRPCARRHPDEVARNISKILETQMMVLGHRIAGALR